MRCDCLLEILISLFNSEYRSLRQRHFPHRCGGVGSDLKRYFDFILSGVLHNTFVIFDHAMSLRSDQTTSSEMSFAKHCEILAEELMSSTLE